MFATDLKIAEDVLYHKCRFSVTDFQRNIEGGNYGACSFLLNGQKVQKRIANITPTKTGQFVTTWKRNIDGLTMPYDFHELDLLIVMTRCGDNIGEFIFPKAALAQHGVISHHGKPGKRGIRVYPPWDTTGNKQAAKTQNWQLPYFYDLNDISAAKINMLKQLFTDH